MDERGEETVDQPLDGAHPVVSAATGELMNSQIHATRKRRNPATSKGVAKHNKGHQPFRSKSGSVTQS